MMNQCKITLKKGGGVKEHFPLGMEDNSVNKCVFCYFFQLSASPDSIIERGSIFPINS